MLLAAITRGFRDLLESRGELTEGLVVRSLVPVSVRGRGRAGVITNRISAVLANLPVGEPDPLRRLALIREQMDEMKRTSQAVGAETLTGMLGFAAPSRAALGSRAAFQLPQPLVQTVTTNVPGPRSRCTCSAGGWSGSTPSSRSATTCGSRSRSFPTGRFSFGITADDAACTDLKVLAKGTGQAWPSSSRWSSTSASHRPAGASPPN